MGARFDIDGRIRRLTLLSYRRWGWFLLVALLLASGAGVLASQLRLRSSFVELLPPNLPSVQNLTNLLGKVGGDGTVLVSVEALDGPSGLEKAEAWTTRLGAELRQIDHREVRSVLDSLTPTENWYADHWPLFVPLAELEHTEQGLSAEVHRRKAEANPLGFDADTDASGSKGNALPADIAPWLEGTKPLPREQVLQNFARYDHGFLVNPDQRSTAILIRPSGTSLGVDEARSLLLEMQAVVDKHRVELDHDHIRVGFAGSFPLLVAAYQAIIRGIASTALLVVVLEMLVLLAYFRELRPMLAVMFAVLMAVIVDFGLTRLAIGYLNTQTGFFGAIVVGNGINFGLVYLGRTRQQRAAGMALSEALADGATTSVRATFLAALASAVSFGVLATASNRGFKHFAFIGGVGMFLCWVATFLLVPAFFGAIEAVWPLRTHFVREQERVLPEQRSHPWLARVFARPRWILAGATGLSVVAVLFCALRIQSVMETNLRHLDNRLTSAQDRELLRDNDRANNALGRSAQGAVALLPSPAAADAYCDVVRKRQAEPRYQPLIASCESLSSVVPADQAPKLAEIHRIVGLLDGALVDTLPPDQAARVKTVREQLASQQLLRVTDAPPSLVDRFREDDGTLGDIAVVTSKPEAQLEQGPNLIAFADASRNVPVEGKTYDAAGEQMVIADLWKNIYREGPRTTLLSLLGVGLLVLVFFREWRRRLEVLATLLCGVVLMAGVGTLLGFRINFFNVMVFPVTFGIAVDYGANVAARIRTRKGAVLPALAEVGPAVLVCSLTSIVGYFSLLFSVNQALQSFGRYAMVGEVTSILTALLVLPALALAFGRRAPIPESGASVPRARGTVARGLAD